MNDPRAWQARQAHRAYQARAEEAEQYRRRRDELVRALRADGWTFPQIAAAVGIKWQLAQYIVNNPPPPTTP